MNRVELVADLSRWDSLGRFDDPSGRMAWGSRDNGPGRGWMHLLCGRYSPIEVKTFMDHNTFALPYKHWEVWTEFIGFNLFRRRFTFWGPHISGRSEAYMHSYDIVIENQSRPWALDRFDGIIFGDIEMDDGEYFLLERRQGEVMAVDKYTEECHFEWENFNYCLESLFDMFSRAFDDTGNTISEIVLSDLK